MKQVSLNQPHATLVSLGIQTVITSNQRIEPGTRVAVKANKTPVDRTRWERVLSPNVGRAWDVALGALPLGVVVCTAVVTDCLPIENANARCEGSHVCVVETTLRPSLFVWSESGDRRDISEQLPYCDWTKRWAWLLADIEHDIDCPNCKGRCYRSGGDVVLECPRCGGSGRLPLPTEATA